MIDILKIVLICLVFGFSQVVARKICGIDFDSRSFVGGAIYSALNVTLCYTLIQTTIPLIKELLP